MHREPSVAGLFPHGAASSTELLARCSVSIWEFPKTRGTFFEVLVTGILLFRVLK